MRVFHCGGCIYTTILPRECEGRKKALPIDVCSTGKGMVRIGSISGARDEKMRESVCIYSTFFYRYISCEFNHFRRCIPRVSGSRVCGLSVCVHKRLVKG